MSTARLVLAVGAALVAIGSAGAPTSKICCDGRRLRRDRPERRHTVSCGVVVNAAGNGY